MNRRDFLASSIALGGTVLAMPHVARGATRTMRLSHNGSLTAPNHYTAEAFKKAAAELSGNTLAFDIYPGAQLGNDAQMIKGTAEGTIDGTVSGTSILSTLFEDCGFTEIPYLFKDKATAQAAYDGAFGDYMSAGLLKAGIQVVGWAESGFRNVTANRAVRTPADLAGLKIRVQPAKLQVETFKALGAKPEPLPFSDLPEALRVGRVEAQENPVGITASNEFLYKLQSHLSLTGHIYSAFMVGISADVMAELTADQRKALMGAGRAAALASREFSAKSDQTNIDKVKAAGMTVVTDVDVASFQKAMTEKKDQIAAIVGADGFNRVRSLVS